MLLDIFFGSITSEIIVIAAIIVLLLLIFKFGNIIFGLIFNSIFGLIAIYLVNYFFGLGLILNWPEWIVVAIFGLPAVAIIVFLKFIGINV